MRPGRIQSECVHRSRGGRFQCGRAPGPIAHARHAAIRIPRQWRRVFPHLDRQPAADRGDAWASTPPGPRFAGSDISTATPISTDNPFDYHGRPLAILKGRLVVFVAVPRRSWSLAQIKPLCRAPDAPAPFVRRALDHLAARVLFQTRMSSYRNLRFDFHGTYGGALGAFVGRYLLVVHHARRSLYPAWVRKRVAYTPRQRRVRHAEVGPSSRAPGRFYAFCLYHLHGLCDCRLHAVHLLLHAPGWLRACAAGRPAEDRWTSSWPAGPRLVVDSCSWSTVVALRDLGLLPGARSSTPRYGGVQIGRQLSYAPACSIDGRWLSIYVTNLLGIVFTLGLYYPWAKVRQARYQLENTAVGFGRRPLAASRPTGLAGRERARPGSRRLLRRGLRAVV